MTLSSPEPDRHSRDAEEDCSDAYVRRGGGFPMDCEIRAGRKDVRSKSQSVREGSFFFFFFFFFFWLVRRPHLEQGWRLAIVLT